MATQFPCLTYQQAVVDTPSRKDGMSQEDEDTTRAAIAQLVQESLVVLLQDAATAAMVTSIACTYLIRFYSCRSMIQNSPWYLVIAAIFLALKVQEVPRKLHDVIRSCLETRYGVSASQIAELQDPAHVELLKDHSLRAEYLLLQTLGFRLRQSQPLHVASQWLQPFFGQQKQFTQCALQFVNDSYRTALGLQFTPEHVAGGCIYLAAKVAPDAPQLPLENDAFHGVPWKQMHEVAQQLLDYYDSAVGRDAKQAQVSAVGGRQ